MQPLGKNAPWWVKWTPCGSPHLWGRISGSRRGAPSQLQLLGQSAPSWDKWTLCGSPHLWGRSVQSGRVPQTAATGERNGRPLGPPTCGVESRHGALYSGLYSALYRLPYIARLYTLPYIASYIRSWDAHPNPQLYIGFLYSTPYIQRARTIAIKIVFGSSTTVGQVSEVSNFRAFHLDFRLVWQPSDVMNI